MEKRIIINFCVLGLLCCSAQSCDLVRTAFNMPTSADIDRMRADMEKEFAMSLKLSDDSTFYYENDGDTLGTPAEQAPSNPASQTVQQTEVQPAEQKTAQTADKTVAKPAEQATSKPASQIVAKPAEQTTSKPASQIVQQTEVQPAEQKTAQTADKTVAKPAKQTDSKPASQTAVKSSQTAQNRTAETKSQTASSKTSSGGKKYYIVVGCFSEQSNVNKMKELIEKKGEKPYIFNRDNGATLVCVRSYNTFAEAKAALNEVQSLSLTYDKPWILNR